MDDTAMGRLTVRESTRYAAGSGAALVRILGSGTAVDTTASPGWE